MDSADRLRFVVAHEELESMLAHPDVRNRAATLPLLVLAHKSDLKDAVSAADLRAELELDRIRNRPCRIFATSAVDGAGLADAIDWLSQEIKKAATN